MPTDPPDEERAAKQARIAARLHDEYGCVGELHDFPKCPSQWTFLESARRRMPPLFGEPHGVRWPVKEAGGG